MGMSASQARYLGLIARQNDLEYQGQQINQERTVLSQQVTDLYNSLQTLNVPTPPSTSEFTSIQYSGNDGTAKFTLGKIVPSGSTYTVNLDYKKTGNSTYSVGKAEVTDVPEKIKVSEVTAADKAPTTKTVAIATKQIGANAKPEDVNGKQILHKLTDKAELAETDDNAEIYVVQNGKFIKTDKSAVKDSDYKAGVYVKMTAAATPILDEEGEATGEYTKNYSENDFLFESEKPETVNAGISRNELSNYYVLVGNTLKHATESDFTYNKDTETFEFKSEVTYHKLNSAGTEMDNPDFTEGIGKALNGNSLMEWDNATTYLTDEQQASALEALRNGFPEYAGDNDTELLNRFYVSFSTEGGLKVPHFTLRNEVDGEIGNTSKTKWATYHDITTTGTYTQSVTTEDCQLTFDTSGRITKIQIPTIDGNSGKIVYRSIDLTASQTTDEDAYKDAYAKYEYQKYEYDKEQQEINAKTEVIQQEDKKLELKLQRLDNERTQITTELEAVKKVITDNIDKTYKTFSG